MTTWVNNKLVEIKYDKLDYWTMYVDGDLSLDEFVLEYAYILLPNEIKEINNLINKF